MADFEKKTKRYAKEYERRQEVLEKRRKEARERAGRPEVKAYRKEYLRKYRKLSKVREHERALKRRWRARKREVTTARTHKFGSVSAAR